MRGQEREVHKTDFKRVFFSPLGTVSTFQCNGGSLQGTTSKVHINSTC